MILSDALILPVSQLQTQQVMASIFLRVFSATFLRNQVNQFAAVARPIRNSCSYANCNARNRFTPQRGRVLRSIRRIHLIRLDDAVTTSFDDALKERPDQR